MSMAKRFEQPVGHQLHQGRPLIAGWCAMSWVGVVGGGIVGNARARHHRYVGARVVVVVLLLSHFKLL